MKTKEKKQYLFTDLDNYKFFKGKEDEINALVDNMTNQAKQVLVKDHKLNYIDFLQAPKQYLINSYWEIASRPKHLENRKEEICKADTGVNLNGIDKQGVSLQRLFQSMSKYAPIIEKNGLKSVLSEDKFKRYLAKDKVDHYKAVKQLFDASRKMEKYGEARDLMLLKFCDGFIVNNLKLEINYHLFAE